MLTVVKHRSAACLPEWTSVTPTIRPSQNPPRCEGPFTDHHRDTRADPLTSRPIEDLAYPRAASRRRRHDVRRDLSYLPSTATRGDAAAQTATAAPWFRANWAVAGRALFEDAVAILTNQRFIDAAAVAFHAVEVIPTTVVVNVNAPMPAGAVHVDIPSFRGATRDAYPLPLLQAMGTSGLFE